MNKRVMAARAAANPTITARHSAVKVLALAPSQPLNSGTRNRSAVRMTGAQRNSLGRVSEWSRSPYAPKGGWR